MKMIFNHLSRGFVHTLLLIMMIMWNSTINAKTHKTKNAHSISHQHHGYHGHKHRNHVYKRYKHKKSTPSHYYAKAHHGHKFKQHMTKMVVSKRKHRFKQTGIASWYGKKFHGRKTANGERYNMYAMTAAHKTLNLPTTVKVTNLKNHKHVIVRVNDRGPYMKNRIIDLSASAARKLGLNGLGMVTIEAL